MEWTKTINPRDFIGRFNPKIHQEKLAKGLRMFGQPLTPYKIVDMCGSYERNFVVDDVKIKFLSDINKFYFMTNNLTSKDRDTMNEIPDIMIRGKVQMYSCNPYTCEIGQMKLYQDPKTKIVHRCIIEDLYCVQPSLSELVLNFDILLIDKGYRLRYVHHQNIYDFSQRINHLLDTEGDAKLAKLNIDNAHDEEGEIFKSFKSYVTKSDSKLFSVKICDYQKDTKTYQIDLIAKNQETFLQRFTKVQDLLKAKEEDNKENGCFEMEPVRRMLPRPIADRRALASKNKTNSAQVPTRMYYGALDYFTKQLEIQCSNSHYVHNKRKLFRVAALDWYGPYQISIVPLDRDYSVVHKEFLKSIKSMKCMSDEEKDFPIRLYAPGEFVVFRNVFQDNQLGPWLRGVVVSMSCYNEHNLVIGQRKTLEDKKKNFEIVKRLVKDKKVLADDLIYRIRSIDYGCECRASPINMRAIKDLKEFKKVGTWALTCKLFGVYFYPGQDRFSRETIHAFDSWMRGKITEDGLINDFWVIFRGDLERERPERDFNKIYEVSLFHRPEVIRLNNDLNYLKPKRTPLECLNWYLVEKGLASHCKDDESYNIQLEDHVMKVLVKHGKI